MYMRTIKSYEILAKEIYTSHIIARLRVIFIYFVTCVLKTSSKGPELSTKILPYAFF